LLPDGSILQKSFPTWSWASRFCRTSNGVRVFTQTNPLETPLIVFYSCLVGDGITRLSPSPDSDGGHRQSNDLTTKWLGQPRIINDSRHSFPGGGQIHSGTLKFWTSVARIYYFCERHRSRGPPRHTFLSANGEILLGTEHLESKAYVSFDDDRIPGQVRSAELKTPQGHELQGECEISILDLVVIGGEKLYIAGGISGLAGSGRMLHTLSVRWEDGIAFREGCVSIAEEHWVLLKNREWKLVTLR